MLLIGRGNGKEFVGSRSVRARGLAGRDSRSRCDIAGRPTEIRLVNDPRAPAFKGLDPKLNHPFRLKEVVAAISGQLAGGTRVNAYHVRCVRKTHGIESKPQFSYKPKFGAPQYSKSFFDWVLAEYKGDPDFFDRAAAAFRLAQSAPK